MKKDDDISVNRARNELYGVLDGNGYCVEWTKDKRARLIAYLAADGFQVCGVFDGEQTVRCTDTKMAMEVIFNLDEAALRVQREGFREHSIALVPGNGADVLTDWNYTEGDPDQFNAWLSEFDPYVYI